MAATWLHTTASISNVLPPILCRQKVLHSIKPFQFSRFFSAARSFSSVNRSSSPVLVQAKRGEELVAASKFWFRGTFLCSTCFIYLITVLFFAHMRISGDDCDVFLLADDLHFESPLKIVEYPDPILRAKNKRIVTFDDNLKKLVDEMFDVMYKCVIYLFFKLIHIRNKCA